MRYTPIVTLFAIAQLSRGSVITRGDKDVVDVRVDGSDITLSTAAPPVKDSVEVITGALERRDSLLRLPALLGEQAHVTINNILFVVKKVSLVRWSWEVINKYAFTIEVTLWSNQRSGYHMLVKEVLTGKERLTGDFLETWDTAPGDQVSFDWRGVFGGD